jgi:TRAP-type mannitol/chloroaromatic compound transport system permease small subunit
MLKKCLRYIDSLSEKIGKIVSILVYGIMGTLVFEVFARYLFNRPTIWAHETSTFFFGAYFLLGGAFCLKREGMISVDIIYARLSRRKQAVLNMITFLFFLAVCYVLIWLGGKEAIYSWNVWERSNTTWEPPLYPLKTVIPLAAFLLFLQGVALFIREAAIALSGKELREE